MARLKLKNLYLAYHYLNNGVHPDTRDLPVRKTYHTTMEIALLLDCHHTSVINGINNDNYPGVILNGKRFLIPDWGYIKFFRERYNGYGYMNFDEIAYEGVIKVSPLARLLECDESLLFYYAGFTFRRRAQTKCKLPIVDIGTGKKRSLRFLWRTTNAFLEERIPEEYIERMRNHGRILI